MMETRKEEYGYEIKVDKDAIENQKSYNEWAEEERIKKNMQADIEWLDKNKHLLYSKEYLKTSVLISISGWKYFVPLWRILAYAILMGLALAWFI
jgi:hypothetical protein